MVSVVTAQCILPDLSPWKHTLTCSSRPDVAAWMLTVTVFDALHQCVNICNGRDKNKHPLNWGHLGLYWPNSEVFYHKICWSHKALKLVETLKIVKLYNHLITRANDFNTFARSYDKKSFHLNADWGSLGELLFATCGYFLESWHWIMGNLFSGKVCHNLTLNKLCSPVVGRSATVAFFVIGYSS